MFEQLIVMYYVPLETWYTRTSIDKVKTDLIYPILLLIYLA